MRLIQFENDQGQRQVGVVGARINVVKGVATTRELALQAIRNGHGLIEEIERLGVEAGPVYAELINSVASLRHWTMPTRPTAWSPALASLTWAAPRRATRCTSRSKHSNPKAS